MHEVTIKLPSDPKLLKIVRCSVSHMCEICQFPSEEKNAIVLAVDEATSNIIRHAYHREVNKPIELRFSIFEDRLEVSLRDYGEKADLEKIRSRDLEDVKPGGLGVHFITSAMDDVKYDNTLPDGNLVTLTKYLPGKRERK